MKRIFALCFASVGCVFFIASGSGKYASSPVDAVTAATVNNRCNFTLPITVESTTATVTWTEPFIEEGTARFCYDTVDPPLNCRAVTPTERTAATIGLTGLNPLTNYYIYFEATKTGETPYAASGSFTTAGSNVIRIAGSQRNSEPLFRIRNGECLVETGLRQGDRIVFSDLSGKILFSHAMGPGERSFHFKRTGASVFLVRCIRSGSMFASRLLFTTEK
jgi:hypothetical protein